jgi:hypothetical protein
MWTSRTLKPMSRLPHNHVALTLRRSPQTVSIIDPTKYGLPPRFLSRLVQEQHNQRLFHLTRFEAEGASAAFVRDLAFAVDYVEPVGHGAVGVTYAVVNFVYQHGHGHFQRGAAFLGDFNPLAFFRGLLEGDAGPVVGEHAPAIGRVGFTNIDRQEFDLVAKTFLQFRQDPRLGSVGASGKAAENKHDRLLAPKLGQGDQILAILGLQ